MANATNLVGRTSELVAQAALLKNGYIVLEPQTVEQYDCVIETPSGEFKKCQIKTILPRKDRNNALVVFSKKGDGKTYTKKEVDMIIGVHGHHVFLIENNEQLEYWSKDMDRAKEKWTYLS